MTNGAGGLMRQLFFSTAPADVQRSTVEAWWQSRWFWWLLALVSILPFLLSPLPPLGDLFNHMGRYHVMLNHGGSEYLDRYYRFRWGIAPNLGQDLLMLPVGALLGAERGALVLSALIPPATILGIRALSKAVHGAVQPGALLALPFVYTFTFIYGFMNFHTGAVIVLWSMVLWYGRAAWPTGRFILVFTLLSLVTWLCHIGAWMLLLVALGSFELVRALREHSGRLWQAGLAVAPRMLPLLLPLILFLFVSRGAPVGIGGSPPFFLKFYFLAFPLRDENMVLDLLSLALLGGVPAVLAILGKLRIELGLALLAGLLFLLFWAIPVSFMNGFYGDMRLLCVIWIAALLAMRFELSPRAAQQIAIGALLLFGVRLAFTTHGWMTRGAALQAELRVLDQVPRGARIASFSPIRTCKRWWNDGLASLPGLAIVRRDAFVNSEWDIPGQQLMQPIYLRGTDYNSATPLGRKGCWGPLLDDRLRDLPRDKFDFVWILRSAPKGSYPWLVPVARGPQSVLYRVAH